MPHRCIAYKKGEFSSSDQVRQQEGIFRSQRERIKKSCIRADKCPSNGKAGGIQIPNATVCLKGMLLNADQSQFFRSAEQVRTLASQMKLKTIMLPKPGHRARKCGETVGLHFTVGICKYKN